MPIVATPASPIILTIDEVRRFMRDYPDKNILLDTIQFTQEDIEQGINVVTNAYNAVTPLTNIDVQGWPSGLKYLLLLGVTWYLVRSEAFLQVRNQMTYQDGDVAPIGVDDKFPLYQNLAQSLKQEWDEMTKLAKTQLNLESAYGTLNSGYLNVSRFHHT